MASRTTTRNGGAPESAPETPSSAPSAPVMTETERAELAELRALKQAAELAEKQAAELAEKQAAELAEKQAAEKQAAELAAGDFSAQVDALEEIKRVRVYVDACKRAQLADSTKVATVQRERFGDGTLGAFQLSCITTGKDDRESAMRIDLESLQAQVDALAAIGVYVIRDRRPLA